MAETDWPSLTLSIANLGLKIECHNAAVINQLRDRFAGFDQAAAIDLSVRVQIDPDRAAAPIDRPAKFKNGSIHFTSIGFTGSIDPLNRHGQLTISPHWPLDDIEYFARVAYTLLAFEAGGLMLHATGIVRHDRAYLFFGPSGSGKSTTARNSADKLILNDDLIILRPDHQHWLAYATPFWNRPQLRPNTNMRAPLAGLYHLVQDRSVFIESIDAARAVAEVTASAPVISGDPQRSLALLDCIDQILHAQIPIKHLHLLPDASFWDVIE
jgi:hypothetical protein